MAVGPGATSRGQVPGVAVGVREASLSSCIKLLHRFLPHI